MPSRGPTLSDDLTLSHRVILRGLKVARARGGLLSRANPLDPGLRRGYADYVRALAIVMDANHYGEDRVLFPALRDAVPDCPWDRLEADHQEMVAPLVRLRDAALWCAGCQGLPGEEPPPADAALAEVQAALDALWPAVDRHVAVEQQGLSPEALSALAPEAQDALCAAWRLYHRHMLVPPELALPFVLYNLAPEERAILAPALAPDALASVEGAWAERWAPMKPFLLYA